jgi:cytochrome c oxidase subunit I
MTQGFNSPHFTDDRIQVAKNWLILGVVCLALAGIAAFFVAAARTPKFMEYFSNPQLFQVALVIHVTLSVQAWMMSISAALWALFSSPRSFAPDLTAVHISWFGIFLILFSPFIGTVAPILNNYIPVIDSPIFLAGIAIFVTGIVLQAAIMLSSFSSVKIDSSRHALHFAAIAGACIMITVPLHWLIVWQYLQRPDIDLFNNTHSFYETSFWASGHILQLVYTQMLLLCWIWLLESAGIKLAIKNKTLIFLWFINLLLGILPIIVTSSVEPDTYLFTQSFTEHMRFAPAPVLAIFGISMIVALWHGRAKFRTAEYSTVLVSGILFGLGGLLAYLIKGQNTVIPAHYHGSTVGVTLAMMGLAYSLTEKFSWTKPSQKWMKIQIWIFGIGQILHITGLAVSGGYGAMRKTAGVVDEGQSLWLGIMGAGGGLAVIGGLIFVVLMIKSIINRPNN